MRQFLSGIILSGSNCLILILMISDILLINSKKKKKKKWAHYVYEIS